MVRGQTNGDQIVSILFGPFSIFSSAFPSLPLFLPPSPFLYLSRLSLLFPAFFSPLPLIFATV